MEILVKASVTPALSQREKHVHELVVVSDHYTHLDIENASYLYDIFKKSPNM